ncbi:Na+/H+ antiporter [Fimbriiglobus ruber]|uniref:Na+/H+ antiporter n=1 Tax=Fimbriiglobus ruber TaxID=1908690 RepID=A0A225E264_9BACT|nr:Na+/H+ antiporter [Fimbriiglobus ruber]OWK43579.1 Na+/H+ antiporter [Fimbriiglobus ruber]
MHPFEVVLILIAVGIGLGILARWWGIPYPILLVVGGLLLSIQPWAPPFALEPNIVFIAFLPPLLYAAAFNIEWSAFRSQLRPITLLAVGLVMFTTVLVAWLAHDVFGMPWAVGFVLGAIVSPPDAVAAGAITQRVKVPRVVSTVLEGESLVNDASALVTYRMAIATVTYGTFSLWEAGSQFVIVSVGGVAVGLGGAWLILQLHRWLRWTKLGDTKINIALTLLTPYAVYLPSEHMHLSGVLATVAAGLFVGTRCPLVFTREFYTEARAVWEMMEFLLNGLIFILIGFQLPQVLNDLSSEYTVGQLAAYALAVCAVVVAARLIWMFPGAYLPRWLDRQFLGYGDPYPPWQSVIVVGWTGMRGVVSLAAAMAIPKVTDMGDVFPYRDLIQFLTFWVIFATLVGQGLTLPFLIRFLGVDKIAAAEPPDESEAACLNELPPTEGGEAT